MKDDTTMRNILISTRDSEKHHAVMMGLAGKRDRSLDRSLKLGGGDLRELLQTMKLVDVNTPTGNNPSKAWAFDFDNPIMNRFVERLSRALLSYEFHQPYFNANFDWRMNVEISTRVYDTMRSYGRLRKVCDIFTYVVTPLKNDMPSWIIANFYGAIEFFIRIAKTE